MRTDLAATHFSTQDQKQYDVSIVSTGGVDHVRRAARVAGSEIEKIEKGKIRKYGAKCQRIGYKFVPLIFNTFGTWGKKMKVEVNMLLKKIQQSRGIEYNHALWVWSRIFSFAFARAQTDMINAKFRLMIHGPGSNKDQRRFWSYEAAPRV